MKTLLFRAVFVASLITTVVSAYAQSPLVFKNAKFAIPFKMRYYSSEGTKYPDNVQIYEREHFYKDNYYHDDTLFTTDVKKYGIDSAAYYWLSTKMPMSMEMHYKLDTQSRQFTNLQYYYNYSYKVELPPNPYTVHTEDYTDFGIDLSSLPYFVQDTILSVDLKGEEFFSRVKSAGLSDGFKKSWQEKYYHETSSEWSSFGIDSNSVIPSCHFEFIVPKNFQSSTLLEKTESNKYITATTEPISGDIVFRFSSPISNTTLYIYDILGRLVHSVTVQSGEYGMTLPSYIFKTGVYFAKLNGKLVKFSVTK